jgi:transposase
MRKTRSSGSVEGVMGNHDPYSDRCAYSGFHLSIRNRSFMFGCMKAYSLDLRQKILRAYDQQLGSQRAIAALFGVSQSFVEKLLRRWRTTGAVAARPHGGGSRPRCDGAALACVQRLVEAQSDATLEELCVQLSQQCSLRVSRPTMSRVLQRLGWPRKKSRSMPRNATASGFNRRVPTTAR